MPDQTEHCVLDLGAIKATWLLQCGPCDFGLVEMGCNCPTGDYRPVMSDLVHEVERQRKLLAQVRLLHFPYRPAHAELETCGRCNVGMELVLWPCPTVQLMQAEGYR